MSTKAIISFTNGYKYNSILLGSDGYVEHAFDILKKYYNTSDKVHELINGGDIAVLRKNYHPNPLGVHTYQHRQPNVTLVLKRDSDYKNDYDMSILDISELNQYPKYRFSSYHYIFDGYKWKVRSR